MLQRTLHAGPLGRWRTLAAWSTCGSSRRPRRPTRSSSCFEACASVINVIRLPGAARKPDGDVILADVAREDASVVLADLRRLGLHHSGSIAVDQIDTVMSDAAIAAERAAVGSPADAVVWEELTERTSESAELSASFLAFMVIATVIASIGVILDSAILIVGAMVVGPEFGPIAGFCVAAVQRRPALAVRSFTALAVGFPLGILVTLGLTVLAKEVGLGPDTFTRGRPRPGEHDRLTRLVRRGDRPVRGRGGNALAEHGEVGRADRGAHLRDDDPRGREHRGRRRVLATGRRSAARSPPWA